MYTLCIPYVYPILYTYTLHVHLLPGRCIHRGGSGRRGGGEFGDLSGVVVVRDLAAFEERECTTRFAKSSRQEEGSVRRAQYLMRNA